MDQVGVQDKGIVNAFLVFITGMIFPRVGAK